MNTKLLIAICCAVGMGIVPFTGAHLTNDNGSATSALATGDGCRYEGPHTGVPCPQDGAVLVSGTYVGPSGLALEGDIFPLKVAGNVTNQTTGEKEKDWFLSICPSGYCLTANAICDLEVGGPGLSPTPPDEEVVDNTAGGNVPDGTWDDGGLGGACHTNTYGYDNNGGGPGTGYNSPGCSGTSHAEDNLLGPEVGLGAACDWESTVTSGGTGPCIVNAAIQGGENLENCLLVCIVASGCPPDEIRSCGSDGSSDGSNYGEGGGSKDGSVTDKSWWLAKEKFDEENRGVPYPTVAQDCLDEEPLNITAQSYILSWVDVELGNLRKAPQDLTDGIIKLKGDNNEREIQIGLATRGWIDQSGDPGNLEERDDGIWINTPLKLPLACAVQVNTANPNGSCLIPCSLADGVPGKVIAISTVSGIAGDTVTTIPASPCILTPPGAIPAVAVVVDPAVPGIGVGGAVTLDNTGVVTCNVTYAGSAAGSGSGTCIEP